ncbi:MAG: choice-of-anchor N protein [Desulfobulbaceae bacterium]|nr:choice-of-anchor N protein [Desulfobulbaceae bacterium]
MRKIVITALTLFMSSATGAYAIPVLQLDSDPGVYVGGDEQSTVAYSDDFTLYALLDFGNLENYADYNFFISAALIPSPDLTDGMDYGSFIFNGQTINVDTDLLFGTPPAVEIFTNNNDLPGHGIYDTWYQEFAVDFSSAMLIDAYNVQPGDDDSSPGQILQLGTSVNIAGLSDELALHFDLYGYRTIDRNSLSNGDIIDVRSLIFAPFSHDVVTGGGGAPVPEPATMLLLGAGLAGLAVIGRKSRKGPAV